MVYFVGMVLDGQVWPGTPDIRIISLVRGGSSSRVDPEVLIMSETLRIESDDVYEAPLLAEAGDFTDLTQGALGSRPEGPGSLYGFWT